MTSAATLRSALLGALLLPLATSCTSAQHAATLTDPATPPPVLPRFGLALDGRPITPDRLTTHAREHEARPAYVVIFEQWPENPPGDLTGLATSLDTIHQAGAIPIITWEPMYYRAADGAEIILTTDEILGGAYDRYLAHFAALLASHPRPTIVRLMHEPNLARYAWAVSKNNYASSAPDAYRHVWRAVVARVRAAAGPEAAGRIRFAFCPNAESVPGPGNSPDHAWNTLSTWWPGAEWVDLVGVDGYNWGDTRTPERHGWRSTWREPQDVLGPATAELRRLAPNLPMFVFETACAPTGGDKAAWLRSAARFIREENITALVWFEANKETDWRLATAITPEDLRTFFDALSK